MDSLSLQEERLWQEYAALLAEREALSSSREAFYCQDDQAVHTFIGSYEAAKKRNEYLLESIQYHSQRLSKTISEEDRKITTVKRNYQSFLRHILPEYLDELADYKRSFIAKHGEDEYNADHEHAKIDILLRMNHDQLVKSVDDIFILDNHQNQEVEDSDDDVASNNIVAKESMKLWSPQRSRTGFPSPQRSSRKGSGSPKRSQSRQMQLHQQQQQQKQERTNDVSSRTIISASSMESKPIETPSSFELNPTVAETLSSTKPPLTASLSSDNIITTTSGETTKKMSRSQSLSKSLKSLFRRKSKKE